MSRKAIHSNPFSCISGERRHNLLGTRFGPRLKYTVGEVQYKEDSDEQPRKSLSSMESGRSLAQAISDMQKEIRQLENENKALRGQLAQPALASDSPKPVPKPTSSQQKDLQETSGHANLRRNLSAPVLEGQYKEKIIMTVRRYSISSNIMNNSRKNEISHKPRRYEETINHKWVKLHDGLHGRPSSAYAIPDMDKLTNRHSLQEYGNKNTAKVKTVTFLLPVDDIYTNRPVMAKPLLPDHSIGELNEIAETDS